MIFAWLRRRRRRKILASPFPPAWETHLNALPFFASLGTEAQRNLRGIVKVLVAEKNWEGCGGFVMTAEAQCTIAAQAGLLLLGVEHEYYRNVDSILVYPSTIVAPGMRAQRGGLVTSGDTAILGLAQHRGPVVLAWDAAHHGAANHKDGRNLVLHEFAHKLDLLDDYADGTPTLRSNERYAAWAKIMTREYDALIDKAERGRRTLLDKYGTTNPAEFFAVATECFFEKGRTMKRRHPELYRELSCYYGQDPADFGA